MRTRAWEGQDGQKRSATEVVATNVQFVGPRERKAASAEQPEKAEVSSIDLEDYGSAEGADVKKGPEEEIPF